VSATKKSTRNMTTIGQDELQRIPPQAVELEKAVLGSIMLDSESMWRIVNVIDETCFYREEHRKIYAAMFALFERQEPYDLLTVTEELKKNKHLESVGGASYLAEILATVATSSNAEYHARQILEKYLLRKVIQVSTITVGECYDPSSSAAEVLERIQSEVFRLALRGTRGGFEQIKPKLQETFEILDQYHKKGSIVTGVDTGYFELNEKTSGLQKSELIIVASRPSMGKTALCMNIAKNVALKSNIPVGYFSLEMDAQQLAMRLLCSEAQVNAHRARLGKLPPPDWRKLAMSAGNLEKAPIYIDDSPGLGILDVRTRARKAKMQYNIGLIILDYLQLMDLPRGAESQQQGIAQISRAMKALAKELQIPVVVISQLSRAVEQRGGERRPQLSDLRDSGAIEQDADMVFFIYRPECYGIRNIKDESGNERPSENMAEIIIGKNRNGPTGSFLLRFAKESFTFQNVDRFMKEPEMADLKEDEDASPADTPF